MSEDSNAWGVVDRSYERPLSDILSVIPDIIFVLELPDLTLTYVSPASTQVVGHPPEAFLRDPGLWRELIEPGDLPDLVSAIEQTARGAEAVVHRFRLRHADGTWRWMEGRAVAERDAEGTPGRIIGALTDVTAQQQAVEATLRSRELLALAVEASQAAFWDVGLEPGDPPTPAEEIYLSERHKAIIGFGPDEFPNSQSAWFERMPPADRERVEQAVREHLQGASEHIDVQYAIRHRDGSLRWIHAHGRAQYDAEGRPVRMLGIDQDVTPQHEAADAVRVERDRARRYLDAAGTLITALDSDARVTLINRTGSQILGLPSDEIVGRHWIDTFIPEDYRMRVREVFSGLMSGEEQIFAQEEGPLLTSDGDIRWIVWDNQVLRDGTGRPEGILGSGLDITERMEAEEALRESEERLALAVEGAGIGFWDWNPQTDASYFSPRWETMLGYAPGELTPCGATWAGLLHPEDREQVDAALDAHLRGESALYQTEFRMRTKSGGWRWVLAGGKVMERDDQGRPLRMTGTHTDINPRKEQEEALRASEERYTTLFRQMLDGFALHEMLYDEEGRPLDYRFLEINPAFERMTGLTAEKVIGRTVRELLPGIEPEWIETYGRVARTGESVTFEQYSGPLERHFQVQAYCPRPGQFATLSLDVTERRRAEASVARKTRALKALSECNTAVVYAHTEQDLLEKVCQVVADVGGYPLAWAGYREPGDEKRIRPVAAAGQGKEYTQDLKVGWGEDSLGAGPTGQAVRTAEPVVSRDLARDEHYQPWRDAALARGFGSSIALPLNLKDETIGNLTIFASEPDAFDEEELGLLVEMSYDLAFGIGALRERQARIAALESLQASESRLATIIEKNADAIIVTDADGVMRFANPAAAKLLGRDLSHLIGQPFAVPAGEQPAEIEILRPGGGSVPAELHNVFTSWSGEPAHLLTLRDLTERRRLEAERLSSAERLQSVLVQAIEAVALTVEKRDPYTAGHQRRVADLATAIARELGFDDDRIMGIHMGGLIHDIGKVYIPAEILSRPGRLSEMEYALVQSHAQVGQEIVSGVDFPWPVADMVGQHHERLDGSGYPLGLKADSILPEARILAVADVVEAISSHRPYRPSLGLEPALEEITRNRGRLYDPDAVDACLALFRDERFAFDRTAS